MSDSHTEKLSGDAYGAPVFAPDYSASGFKVYLHTSPILH
jgi:hypothetical protein